MIIEIDGKDYPITIVRKNNKNMYLRIKSDLSIVVTAPVFVSKSKITSFVSDNRNFIAKSIRAKAKVIENKKDKFQYLGKNYEICHTNKREIILGEKRAFIGTLNIDNWYKKKAKEVFEPIYDECFNNFDTKKSKPELKIRKMTSKWGVCNVTNHTITLNLELIKYDLRFLEYVIYHELCHLKYPNHSKEFWDEVAKYVPNHKQIKKEMKNV